jgi:hypothetical protein
MEIFKFDFEYYFLEYTTDAKDKQGAIYRYGNDKMELIYGNNEDEIQTPANTKKELINNKLQELISICNIHKEISLDNQNDRREIEMMNKYNYHNNDKEQYYNKISLCHLDNDDNVFNCIDINHDNPNIQIGLLFGFIETSKFNIDTTKIEYQEGGNNIKTEIDFQSYKNCIQSNINNINTISKFNKKGGAIPISKITTEQKFIKHDRIMDLFHGRNIDNAMPVIIEYDYKLGKFFIVDGNHRVSYHILNNFKYIPVMIIFKEIIISTKRKSSRISSISSYSKKSRLGFS